MRLKDRGPHRRCNKCGYTGRHYSGTCHRTVDGNSCGGDAVIDDVRNAIDLAHEKLEDTKRRLLKAEKALKNMENPLYQHPRRDVVYDNRIKKRDKLRRQLTEMGFDWRGL